MPRKPRIQSDNSIFHVLSRGNNKEIIFRDEEDFCFFLKTLLIRKRKYDFKILCFALMPNHFHILIKTTDKASLSIIMKSGRPVVFASNNNRVGHVFQDRFKSFICLKDTYLVSLISYIHQNPKRANLVIDSSEYRFSSLQVYLKELDDELVDKSFVIDFLEESFGRSGTVLIKKMS